MFVTLNSSARPRDSGAPARALGLPAQFFRYGVVGMVQNAAAFLLYLGLAWHGVGHKTAMTLVFVLAILATFYFNKSWSFRSAARSGPAMLRYAAFYVFGYALNWLGIWTLADSLGYPHQWVQLAMIILVAMVLFASLHLWVFPQASASAGAKRQGHQRAENQRTTGEQRV